MNTEKPYIIEYNYTLEFNGRVLGFRKKELFDITETPKHVKFAGHWNVNKKQLSKSKAQELITNNKITKDITDLQWYQQEQLNGVFNLY